MVEVIDDDEGDDKITVSLLVQHIKCNVMLNLRTKKFIIFPVLQYAKNYGPQSKIITK